MSLGRQGSNASYGRSFPYVRHALQPVVVLNSNRGLRSLPLALMIALLQGCQFAFLVWLRGGAHPQLRTRSASCYIHTGAGCVCQAHLSADRSVTLHLSRRSLRSCTHSILIASPSELAQRKAEMKQKQQSVEPAKGYPADTSRQQRVKASAAAAAGSVTAISGPGLRKSPRRHAAAALSRA